MGSNGSHDAHNQFDDEITQSVQDKSTSLNEIGGGVLRSMLRSTARRLVSSGIGSMPNVHPQVIAKSSSNFGDFMELVTQFRAAYQSTRISEPSATPTSSSSLNGPNRKSVDNLKTYSKLIANSIIPGFVKNSILGSILFAVYDKYTSANQMFVPDEYINSFIVGVFGGCCHAFVSVGWDIAALKLKNNSAFNLPFRMTPFTPISLTFSISGTFFVHSVTHGSFFGSYVCTKSVLDQNFHSALLSSQALFAYQFSSTDIGDGCLTNKSREVNGVYSSDKGSGRESSTSVFGDQELAHVLRFISISIAGAVSGIVAEGISYYLEPIECVGLFKGVKLARHKLRPTMRLLGSAMAPSVAGFLAYEYGKVALS